MSQNIVLTPADDPVIVITRSFEAPQALVFNCYTEPRHMVHFWGPHGSTTPVCEIDLRPGGVWRTVMRFASGQEFGYTSVYLEIVPRERIVYRDAPDDWKGGLDGLPPVRMHSTIALEADGSGTRVTATVRCPSIAIRDEQIGHGFAEMVKVGNDRLAAYLASLDPAVV